jgi:hypothetical protein
VQEINKTTLRLYVTSRCWYGISNKHDRVKGRGDGGCIASASPS